MSCFDAAAARSFSFVFGPHALKTFHSLHDFDDVAGLSSSSELFTSHTRKKLHGRERRRKLVSCCCFTSISPISDYNSLASTFRGNRQAKDEKIFPIRGGKLLNCFSARSLSPLFALIKIDVHHSLLFFYNRAKPSCRSQEEEKENL
jgi:hypothetical protein